MIGASESSVERFREREEPIEAPRVRREPWRELAPWRETTLFHCTAPHLRRMLEYLGTTLAEAAAESFSAADLRESCLQAEIRAALHDLQYLQGFLARVGESAKASDLNATDRRHAAAARRFAHQVARISAGIEKHLDPEPQAS